MGITQKAIHYHITFIYFYAFAFICNAKIIIKVITNQRKNKLTRKAYQQTNFFFLVNDRAPLPS